MNNLKYIVKSYTTTNTFAKPGLYSLETFKSLTSAELHCIYTTILLLKSNTKTHFLKKILLTSVLIRIDEKSKNPKNPYSGRNVWVGAVGSAEEGKTLQERSVVIGGEAEHVENHLRSTVQ